MPRTRKDEAPILLDEPEIQGRYAEVGDHTVSFETYHVDADPDPLFSGLPEDRCQCPHWGIVQSGRLCPTNGGVWMVGPHGATSVLPDAKGLHYLQALLGRPGRDVSALDLSDAVAGHPGLQVQEGDLGPVLDPEALAAYRRRLTDLDVELDEARAWADLTRASRLDEERSALVGELARATGLSGRPRRRGDARERARVAVRKAIASAIGRIEAVDPATAWLLRRTIITGGLCRYDPDPARPVRWVLNGP
jgi:hypothetical protein